MDREKIIKEWETVLSRDPLDAPWDLIDDTLALLKELEAKYGYWINPTSQDCHCSECGEQPVHEPGESVPLYDFCPYCGAKMEVKWNDRS